MGKKLFLILTTAAMISACGGGESGKEGPDSTSKETKNLPPKKMVPADWAPGGLPGPSGVLDYYNSFSQEEKDSISQGNITFAAYYIGLKKEKDKLIIVQLGNSTEDEGKNFTCSISSEKAAELERSVRPGQVMIVNGKIQSVSSTGMFLSDCECKAGR